MISYIDKYTSTTRYKYKVTNSVCTNIYIIYIMVYDWTQ